MADTKTAGVKPLAEVNLTDKELKHLTAAWLSCAAGDSIDYEMFAVLAGYPSVTNARKRLGEVKKRVRAQVFGDGDGDTAPGDSSAADPATPAQTPKKAAKAPRATPKRKNAAGETAGETAGGSAAKRARASAEKREDAGAEEEAAAGGQAIDKEAEGDK